MRTTILRVALGIAVTVMAGAACAAPDASHDGTAAGGHAAGAAPSESEKPPLLSFDPGMAVWSIIVFVLLLLVLRAFAWKPILQALQQREAFIRDALDQAKKDRQEAERNLKKHAAELKRARDEAEAIVAGGRRDAEVVRLKIKEEAENEAEAILERAKRDIDLARTTAIKEIYEVGAELATRAAGKILRREVDAKEHERLIAESIEELAGRKN